MDLCAAPFYLKKEQCSQLEKMLASMTDGEKIGQLFCVMGGDYRPETLCSMVAEGRVGGVLFRPVQTGEEIRAMLDRLDAVAKIPLLKAANLEEGGSGARSDGTLFGWPMLAAATDREETAGQLGMVCGREAAEIGVNWSFSPVCDLNLNVQNPITNVRTFGSDKTRVERMVTAYVDALQTQGVAACPKHFPGDGVDYRDQHLHPTVNSLDAQAWDENYGEIYRRLIGQGVRSIMVGHIAQPAVARQEDPSLDERQALMPASLSPTLLQKVLRQRLGFQGLICSDATIMAGYTTAMPRAQALAASIMAGCDMLVFNTDFEEDYGYLMASLESGALSRQRLDEAVRRVLALKLSLENGAKIPGPQLPESARLLHRKAADLAVTLVKDLQPQALPMTVERYPDILLIPLGMDAIRDGSVTEIAKNYLEKQGFAVTVYDRQQDELHGTAALPKDRLTLYLANFEQFSNQTAIRIPWSPKHALDVPRFCNEEVSVFVSLANPYHLQDVPRVKTYINAYTATRDTIELVIDKLMGRSAFCGVSPVDAFCGLPDTRL